MERARDTTAAAAAFEQAHACASEHGLPVMRIKSLQELATIGMYETLSVGQLEEARRDALAAGALSITAMVDVALAATYSCRGRAIFVVGSSIISRQWAIHPGRRPSSKRTVNMLVGKPSAR